MPADDPRTGTSRGWKEANPFDLRPPLAAAVAEPDRLFPLLEAFVAS